MARIPPLRSLLPLLPLLLAGGLAGVPTGCLQDEDDERTPLVVRKQDEVHLKDGTTVSGRITDDLPDNGVVVKIVGSSPIQIPGEKISYIMRKQTASMAVRSRGREDLNAGDNADLERRLRARWGLANDAHDAAIKLAHDAIDTHPSTELAERLVPILLDTGDSQSVLDLLSAQIKAKPDWSKGYELKAQVLKSLGRNNDLSQLVDQWLAMDPSAQTPLRFRADAAEMSGDLRTARDSYFKLFDLHQDWASGVGFARTTLRMGNAAEALETVQKLIQANQQVGEAKAIGGAALLVLGDEQKAKAMLTEAAASRVLESAAFVAYDLGLILYRHGDLNGAEAMWKPLTLPAAQLGLAMIDGREFSGALPPELVPVQAEYNLSIDLESKKFEQAQALLDKVRPSRRDFLAQVTDLKVPSEDKIKALQSTPGDESLHWQLYGDVQLRHWAAAETVLSQLPANDGYAAVCRVYMAAARRDLAGAKALFEKARESANPPKEYLSELAHEFEGVPETVSERFDVAFEELASREWTAYTPATGITLDTKNNMLVFSGTQATSQDAVSSLMRPVPGTSLRFAMAIFDIGDLNGASGGIMLLDKARANGVAFGVMGNGRLAPDGELELGRLDSCSISRPIPASSSASNSTTAQWRCAARIPVCTRRSRMACSRARTSSRSGSSAPPMPAPSGSSRSMTSSPNGNQATMHQGADPRAPLMAPALAVALLALLLVSHAPEAGAAESASATSSAPVRWDYLPLVGYVGDELWFSLRVGAAQAGQWTVSADGHAVDSHLGPDSSSIDVGLPLRSGRPRQITFHGPSIERSVRLVLPGQGGQLHEDAQGRLAAGDQPAVLVVRRTDDDHDRRWRSLRASGPAPDVHCKVRIRAPLVPSGDSGLLAEIVSSQALTVAGLDVLLEVPASDRFASWKHREFRQALAWLVSDLRQRGARRIVLLDPLVAESEAPLVKLLIVEIADIASAYHCTELSLPQLSQERFWQVSPGVLGPCPRPGQGPARAGPGPAAVAVRAGRPAACASRAPGGGSVPPCTSPAIASIRPRWWRRWWRMRCSARHRGVLVREPAEDSPTAR